MLAAVVTAVGGTWEMQNVPQVAAGPSQVLVKLHASSTRTCMKRSATYQANSPEFLGTNLLARLSRSEPVLRHGRWHEALDFVAKGKVKVITETYKLDEAPKAYQRVVEGKARFRAVLTM